MKTVRLTLLINRVAVAMGIKITFDNLIEVYDAYIEKHKIVDLKVKRAIHWAMFYCAKEGREWEDSSKVS